ncbi:MAG: septal ring lytic transglycosylase RlpA family protein [Alphaproteobacteria bacterium]|jgi:rare lipoprotein A|nr:MAG: septal ring lytic transglycosylase RlpA family protein [Alphaproteobacteria bacterium]
MRVPLRPFAVACLGLFAAALLASGCSNSERPAAGMEPRSSAPASHRVIAYGQPVPKGGGSYKVGDPYQIDGQWHTPREDPGYDRTGIASYYAHDFHGRRTANGEIFDMSALSAAHPTLPLPSLVYVTNMENGRTLLLRVNDRGPYVNNRVIDVSRAAARYLGFETRGTARVRVRYAGRAPLTGDDRQEQRFLASQSWFRVALSHAPYASR